LRERDDLLANIRESFTRDPADSAATAALLEAQELANLIERKTQTLRPLDEPEPVNRGYWIASHAASALWHSQQTPALVIPHSFDPNLGRPCKLPDGNSVISAT
jgi:hypothetical protein